MEKKNCYKCGKRKVAILDKDDREFNKIKMVMLTYGKHKFQYQCKDCKESE